jgi:OmpA-OmpF porin, OOP family
MARLQNCLGFASLIIFLFLSVDLYSQSTTLQDSLIVFSGHVYDENTKEPVRAKITYEKLPYGDDYGIASADSGGYYNLSLITSNKYSFIIKADGYNTLKDSVTVDKTSKMDSFLTKDFYLTPGGVGQIIRLKKLFFDQSTSDIPSEAFPEIDMIVQMLKENPKMVIQLEGHTDFRGNSKLNFQLSEKRVEAIRNYIYSKGIDRKRVKVKAFGGSMPLSRENTEDAKRANRRVEVRVMAI